GGGVPQGPVEPLQARNRLLASQLARQAPGEAGAAGEKLDIFYAYLGRNETATDWLAKLYAIGKATGVELQSASYRTRGAERAEKDAARGTAAPGSGSGSGRIERYEIVLPVAGSYPQLREFLKRALEGIPVLPLDQMTLKRESRNDGAVQ